MKLATLLVVCCLAVAASAACVDPPKDLEVCVLPPYAKVPEGYDNTVVDRQLLSFTDYLERQKALPTPDCLLAYLELECSNGYPRCAGDRDSGLSYPVNTCFYVCHNFRNRCRGQLLQVERPDCGGYSVDKQCTYRKLRLFSDPSSASAMTFTVVGVLATAILAVLL